ncbi:hypothetical protein KY343_05525 [Candidatus Woesearchaeota archaeon]|nr:hypothetical protein [Candidatus Woesearchaeota archaeon]
MKTKFIFGYILILMLLASLVCAVSECDSYESFRLFGTENVYVLNGKSYDVSIKESKINLNTFNVTINGVTYPDKHYESSFTIDTGETVFLGQAYAASPVMYTSIDFCMKATEKIEEKSATISEEVEEEKIKINFWQRIINWFKELF